jgi:hypothetical protein
MEFKNMIGYFVKDAIIYMTHRQVMRAGVCVVERDVVNDIPCVVVSHTLVCSWAKIFASL